MPSSRVFGQEIGGNGREVSVGGRRHSRQPQLAGHLDKVPGKHERESFVQERASESPVAMEIEGEPTELLQDPAEQYEQDISRHLVGMEARRAPLISYFSLQPDVSVHMRSILLNWLVEVHLKYKLLPQTLFVAVGLLDRYLEKNIIHRSRLQLLGITSLWVAAKFEEIYQVPKISNLIFICDSTYSRTDILEMEGGLLLALNFDLLEPHSYTYLQLFVRHASLDEKDYFLARYLIEICLLDFRMTKYTGRCLAAAAIFFIRKIRKRQWEQELQETTGLRESDIRQCARDICSLLQNIDENEHM